MAETQIQHVGTDVGTERCEAKNPEARYMGSMTPLSGGPVMKGIIFAR